MNQFPFPRSTSQRRIYRDCGTKYVHRYQSGWKSKTLRGTYAFGNMAQDLIQQCLDMHGAERIAKPNYILVLPDIAKMFKNQWEPLAEDKTLTWTTRASHKQLLVWGGPLLTLALKEIVEKVDVTKPMIYEPRINFRMGDDDELALPDFVGIVGGKRTILDWKTSDRDYNPLTIELDEQLSDYQLAVNRDVDGLQKVFPGPVEQVGLVVLVYGVKPRVQWLLVPARTEEELKAFEDSAAVTNRLIREGVFYRNERSCFKMGTCEMVPLCYGSQKHLIAETLVQEDKKRGEIPQGLLIDAEE